MKNAIKVIEGHHLNLGCQSDTQSTALKHLPPPHPHHEHQPPSVPHQQFSSRHRQRPSHWRVFGFRRPVQVRPGGGVIVVSQRCNVGDQVDTARVPSLHKVCRRPIVLSSSVIPGVPPSAPP